MKAFRIKNLFNLIYGILLGLPFFDIISRVIYVQSNKNAYQSYGGTGTLDNVFEYSMGTFIQNNQFGKLNLFSWFFDLFLDSSTMNNMYIQFINWYLNFVLLVSLTYVLFLVLMWFVNFARRILTKSFDFEL